MTERVCDWCGKEFHTLSKARLHDCPQKHEKMAEQLTLEGLRYTDEGVPLAVFTVEIPEGEEWGAYMLALSVVNKDGKQQFAFLDGENNIVAALDPDPEVIEWLDAALEHNSYVTATNYQPSDDYGIDELDYFAVAGRTLGQEFDSIDREEFTDENRDRVRQIRETLAGPRGEVSLEQMDESLNYRPPLDTSNTERVVEFAIEGNPEREPRIIDTRENVNGIRKLLLVKHGFEIDGGRPINAVPLTPDIGRTYVRLVFADEEQAVDYFENFEALPPSDEMVRMVHAMLSVDTDDLS